MLSQWRIYCNTEDQWSYGWQVNPPTVCFNNPAHTVNPNSISEEVYPDAGLIQIIKDVKSISSSGGGINAKVWTTRELNTSKGVLDNYISLSSNQLTIQPGVYYIDASAPAYRVNNHQIRFQNITDNVTEAVGSSEKAYNNIKHGTSRSVLKTFLNIDTTKTFELQHYVQSKNNNDGLGISTGFGLDETYTEITIRKIK